MRRLLLLPLLAPLAAVLLTGALNPRPMVSLRLLVWQSPALPLGVWLAAAAGVGAGLSGGGAALALGQASPPLRRQVRRGAAEPEDWREGGFEGRGRGDAAGSPARGGAWARWAGDAPDARRGASPPAGSSPAAAGPGRQPGEPPPTVAVAYRVIRRGSEGGSPGWAGADTGAPTVGSAAGGVRRQAEPVPVADDWGEANLEDW